MTDQGSDGYTDLITDQGSDYYPDLLTDQGSDYYPDLMTDQGSNDSVVYIYCKESHYEVTAVSDYSQRLNLRRRMVMVGVAFILVDQYITKSNRLVIFPIGIVNNCFRT